MTRKAGMLATALLGSLLAAGWLVTPPTKAQIFGLSESQEVELGREAARQVEREQPILRDEQVIHYVNAPTHDMPNLVAYHASQLAFIVSCFDQPAVDVDETSWQSKGVNVGTVYHHEPVRNIVSL